MSAVARARMWRVYYNMTYRPKMGLMYDDTQNQRCPIVLEALNRLPEDVSAQRTLRISRATALNSCFKQLPREEWMTPEKEVRYLQPYIQQVKAEIQQKKELEHQRNNFKIVTN